MVIPVRPLNDTSRMARRMAFVLACGLLLPAQPKAQMSQRARQIRERRACERDLPDCRPEIRQQLEAESRRLRIGMSGLAVVIAVIGAVLWWRIRARKAEENQHLHHLNEQVADISRKLNKNRAQSTDDAKVKKDE